MLQYMLNITLYGGGFMNLFEVVPHAFFKPLVSKYKHLYFDCIQLLYSSYRSELSFGIDKVIIINVLEQFLNYSTPM